MIVSHPTGNTFVRALLLGLREEGLLKEFATTLAFKPSSMYLRWLPKELRDEMLRRSYDLPSAVIHRHPWREVARFGASRLGWKSAINHEKGWASVDAVYRSLDRHVAARLPFLARSRGVRGIYAYEDGAEASFLAAKQLGMPCMYDLPIGYWRAGREILREEAERRPDWAVTLSGNLDSEEKLGRKDHEISLANCIFVASQFTLRTLLRAPVPANASIIIAGYGAPPPIAKGELDERLKQRGSDRLKVLFVGGLSQRKGIADAFDAVKMLGQRIELTVIGRTSAMCPALERGLESCRYIPSLSHSGVLHEMRRHDVLLFPSLFEGFGLVILEAMAQGMPVITTAHTGGPDVITDGVDGFIVPIRSPEAMVQKLEKLLTDIEYRKAVSEAAWLRVHEITWKRYSSRIVTAVRPAMGVAA